MDLRASVEGGAQAIGVTTGVFTRADLEECGAGAPLAFTGTQRLLCISCSSQALPYRLAGKQGDVQEGHWGRGVCRREARAGWLVVTSLLISHLFSSCSMPLLADLLFWLMTCLISGRLAASNMPVRACSMLHGRGLQAEPGFIGSTASGIRA